MTRPFGWVYFCDRFRTRLCRREFNVAPHAARKATIKAPPTTKGNIRYSSGMRLEAY
jgi:hypothetical protein